VKAWLDLGSNLERNSSLRRAIHLLARDFQLLRTSQVYETAPVGFADQPNFYNLCAEIETPLSAAEIRLQLRRLEDEMGRVRGANKYGPRNIDIDLVLHEVEVDEKLPHPQVEEALFVLLPLCELIPDFVHPGRNLTLRDLLAQLPRQEGDIRQVSLD